MAKKGCTKECSNHWTIALISNAGKVMLKILHARLQHYVNQEFPKVQAGFRKGRVTRDQIVNFCWIMEKAKEFQKTNKQTHKQNIYLYYIDYAKAFDSVIEVNVLFVCLFVCFLEFLCFLHDPTAGDSFISGSSVSSKPSLYIWKFLVQILLKPSLKDFEYYLASM